MSELKKSLFSPTFKTPSFRTQRTMALTFSITFMFVTCVVFFVFNNPSVNHSSLWFKKILEKRSHFSTFFSLYNYSSVSQNGVSISLDKTMNSENGQKGLNNENLQNVTNDKNTRNETNEPWWEKMSHCDIFDGKWVKDEFGPLYEPGSCPHIDEPFDCYKNGRSDNGYENFRWQPKHCNIPRFNAKEMLELLSGKRLVYVGDSLNRYMWESMVCLLRNSVEDKTKVFEASGRHDFKKEGACSFIFLVRFYPLTVDLINIILIFVNNGNFGVTGKVVAMCS
uniref:Protein trichome birefringence-like n=1 Tax=Nicotiana sylvestris TaxID=4096 RepID=A0A1U7W761_NICSY|nr:PREDICTED: protein trichome birefringence-like [Nicotiana sylvestris]